MNERIEWIICLIGSIIVGIIYYFYGQVMAFYVTLIIIICIFVICELYYINK